MASKLRDLRKRLGITQATLAQRSGVNRVTIARYEAGTCKPSFERAIRIADALGVTVEQLRGDEHEVSDRGRDR